MMANVGIFLMLIVLPLNNIYGCIPTRNIDDAAFIPLTTTTPPPPPPPCSSCPIPVQTIDDDLCGLTITPCDKNNRLIYSCDPACIITTQNEPTDGFIFRGSVPIDVICDSSSGSYFIGIPTDQIKTLKCE